MKDLVTFVHESIEEYNINEDLAYDGFPEVESVISDLDDYNDDKKFSSGIKCLVLQFNKTNGKLKNETFSEIVDGTNWLSVKRVDFMPWQSWVSNTTQASSGIRIINNTKKDGIIIVLADESNKNVVVDFVTKNLDAFDMSSTKLAKDEIDEIDGWFKTTVKNYQIESNKGTCAIYFKNKEDAASRARTGANNISHLTISKPRRLKGGFGVTLYKSGNWAASEFPSAKSPLKADGSPKYATLSELFELFNKNIVNGKWADRLGIELK